jgi:hypothetical protein
MKRHMSGKHTIAGLALLGFGSAPSSAKSCNKAVPIGMAKAISTKIGVISAKKHKLRLSRIGTRTECRRAILAFTTFVTTFARVRPSSSLYCSNYKTRQTGRHATGLDVEFGG